MSSPNVLRTLLAVFLVPVLLLSIVGCTAETNSTDAPATEEASTDETAAAKAAPDVDVEILSFDEIQERIADKRGRVVVMDAWSTSCPPCMKDFHNLVELHKEYPAEDLACISLSFDYEGLGTPEEAREPVIGFLKTQGATFDNLMSNEESDVLYRKLDLNAVPAVFVYDRSGKLRQRFESEGAYEQVRQLVAELVAEPAADKATSETGNAPADAASE